ncbi:MAG: ABC transporter permease [Ignavibacteriaceae bacterium]|nr:ABC transporter permease [Ignavibacteriaceae bacterium]
MHSKDKKGFFFLISPPLFWFSLFLCIPLIIVILYSFGFKETYGNVILGLNFENYAMAFDPLYLGILFKSILIAIAITFITLILGFPVAYFLAFAPVKLKIFLSALIILPLWTNFLIKVYSFIILLGENGLVNNLLISLGLIDSALPLYNNLFSLFVVFIYINLPFMIMPVFASIDKIDKNLLEASMDLGANKLQTLMKIILPYSLPGIAAGVVFVFVPTLSNFLVPELAGGIDNYMIGNVINSQFLQARNWPLGSAISAILIFLVLVLVSVYIKYFEPGKNSKRTEIL